MGRKIITLLIVIFITVGLLAVVFVSGALPQKYALLAQNKIIEIAQKRPKKKKKIFKVPPEADFYQKKFGAEIDDEENLAKDEEEKLDAISKKEELVPKPESPEKESNAEENTKEKNFEEEEKQTEGFKPAKEVLNKKKLTPTYENLINRAKEYLAAEEHEKAIEYLQKAFQKNEKNVEPLFHLSLAYLSLNQLENVEKTIQKAQKLNPNNPVFIFLRGRYFLSRWEYDQAKQEFIKLVNQNQKGVFYQGVVAAMKSKHPEAQEMFKLSKELGQDQEYIAYAQHFLDAYEEFYLFEDGKREHLWALLARALNLSEIYHCSEVLCMQILKSIPNYVDAWNQLGFSRLGLLKYSLAEDAFRESYRLDPISSETHYLLAFSLDSQSKVEDALTFYEIAIKNGFSPQYVIYERLADLYFSVEKYREAVKFYRKNLSEGDNSLESYVRPIWIYIEHLREPEEALVLALDAAKSYPEEAMSQNLLGWCYLAMNKLSEAKENLKKAIKLDPNFASPYLNLGIVFQQEGERELSKKNLKKAIELGRGTSVGNLASQIYASLNREL